MSTMTLPGNAPPIEPRPYYWTCEEFHNHGEAGFFEGRRPFLIDGKLMEQGPMNPPHAIAIELCGLAFQPVFGAGWRIRVQLPLVLSLHTDPVPDFAMVTGSPRDKGGIHPTTAALVVEIADTSLRMDLNDKAGLYAMAGVPDYWVLDLPGRRLHVLREPKEGVYADRMILAETETIAPFARPDASILVADLLP